MVEQLSIAEENVLQEVVMIEMLVVAETDLKS